MPCSTASDEPWTIPTGLETSLSVAGHEPAERSPDLLRHLPGHPERLADRADDAVLLGLLRPHGHELRPSSRRARPSASTARRAMPGSSGGSTSPSTCLPLIARIRSPAWTPAASAGVSASTSLTVAVTLVGRAAELEPEPVAAAQRHEERGEDDDREDEVRGRPGEDDRDPLPRRRAPVGVRRERVLDLRQTALGRALRERRDRRVAEAQPGRAPAPRRRRRSRSRRGAAADRRPAGRAAAPPRSRGRSGRRGRPAAGRCMPGIFT